MLKLIEKTPFWREVLPGVEIEFAPVDNRAWRAAKRAAAGVAGLTEQDIDKDELHEEMGDAFSRALIERGIRAWRGVGDANGEAIEPSPEAITLFLSDPRRFEACDAAYVLPMVREAAEGNVSAASPNGISSRVTAARTIATSAAPGPRAVKTARTKSKHFKPKKASSPGKRSRRAEPSCGQDSAAPTP